MRLPISCSVESNGISKSIIYLCVMNTLIKCMCVCARARCNRLHNKSPAKVYLSGSIARLTDYTTAPNEFAPTLIFFRYKLWSVSTIATELTTQSVRSAIYGGFESAFPTKRTHWTGVPINIAIRWRKMRNHEDVWTHSTSHFWFAEFQSVLIHLPIGTKRFGLTVFPNYFVMCSKFWHQLVLFITRWVLSQWGRASTSL